MSLLYSYRNTRFNSAGVIVLSLGTEAVVSIEKATSQYNGYGMFLQGATIHVKDSTTSFNVGDGIVIVGNQLQGDPTKVQFEGESSSHKNRYGISLFGYFDYHDDEYEADGNVDVIIKGELNSYQNSRYGLEIYDSVEMPSGFVVEDKGSLIACQNGEQDIINFADVDFVDENTDGDGFMCDVCADDHCSSDDVGDVCVACPTCNELSSETTMPSESPSVNPPSGDSNNPPSGDSNNPPSCYAPPAPPSGGRGGRGGRGGPAPPSGGRGGRGGRGRRRLYV